MAKKRSHVVVGHPIAELTRGGKVKEMEKPAQRRMKHAVVLKDGKNRRKATKECMEEEEED